MKRIMERCREVGDGERARKSRGRSECMVWDKRGMQGRGE